jgi:uncharacterized membrane protein YfcA
LFSLLSPEQWALASTVVFCGALVQGTAGFGFAITCAPLLRLIGPNMIPVPILTAASALIVLSMLRERRDISLQGAGWVIAARVPGALVGAFLLGVLPDAVLSVVIATLVLFAVVTIASGWSVPFNRVSQSAAGFISGVTGTATSIGGPPIALLYRERRGPELRSTLAAIFTVGMVINFAALGANGEVRADEVWIGVGLIPGTVLGFIGSSFLRRHVEGARLRAGVLIISSFAAVGLLVRTLLSSS